MAFRSTSRPHHVPSLWDVSKIGVPAVLLDDSQQQEYNHPI